MRQRFEQFELDRVSLTLYHRGRLVELPGKTVELLAVLVEHSGSILSKTRLMDTLWPDGFIEEGNLTQHVYLLRKTLRERGSAVLIETAPRRGYCLRLPAPRARRRPALAAALVFLFLAGSSVTSHATALQGQALAQYTAGRSFWNLRSPGAMARSVAYFQHVIGLAPRSASGYAALADAYTELADLEQPCAQCVRWQRAAQTAAARALALDPDSAEAHVAYGMVRRVFDSDDATAAREFEMALHLDPQNALANQWYGNMLIANGDTAKGLRLLHLAAEQQPVATATYAWLARGYYYERQYRQAVYYARQALAIEPTRLETTVLLGLADEGAHDYAAARRQFQSAARLGISTADAHALLAAVDAATGDRAAALHVLHRLAKSAGLDFYASRDVVIGLAITGDKAAARARLEQMRYRTPLDRRLTVQDPFIRDLGAS